MPVALQASCYTMLHVDATAARGPIDEVAAMVGAVEGEPRISVVTPSYNQGEFLEATLRSVITQGYPNLEYVVIDGGSSDDSAAIIKRLRDRSRLLGERARPRACACAEQGLRPDHRRDHVLDQQLRHVLSVDPGDRRGDLLATPPGRLDHGRAITVRRRRTAEGGRIAVRRQRLRRPGRRLSLDPAGIGVLAPQPVGEGRRAARPESDVCRPTSTSGCGSSV